jgi:hypothetical protein
VAQQELPEFGGMLEKVHEKILTVETRDVLETMNRSVFIHCNQRPKSYSITGEDDGPIGSPRLE